MMLKSEWLVTGAAATAVLATAVLLGPAMESGKATSHWDAPATFADKVIDATDLYAFTSPDKTDTVTIVANYIPFQIPLKPYQFDTNVQYEIHVDNTGDGKPAITYRWTFRNKGLPVPSFFRKREHQAAGPESLVSQTFTLTKLTPGQPDKTLIKDGYVGPSDMGPLVTPGYASLRKKAVLDLPGGGKVFTGQAADPFYGDNKAVSLLRFGMPFPAISTGVPMNVDSLALQLPKSELALKGDAQANPVIGVWTTAARKGLSGGYKQVSRLGNPNFNEAIIPLESRDRFNGTRPEDDQNGGLVVESARDPKQAKTVEAQAGVKAPAPPRKDLEEIYLTGLNKSGPIKEDLNAHSLNRDASGSVPAEELRLNLTTAVTAKPHKYGYLKGDKQGYPNGRRLTDDVVTVNLRMLLGEPASAGAPGLIDENNPVFLTKPITGSFPYLALPVSAT
jgi:hypothetical protein